MSREIKFRVWDNNNKNMIKQELTDRVDKCPHYYETHIKTTLLQYTGLKDKNGVEIYEGDIFEQNLEKYEVKYHDKLCCFVGYYSDDEYELFSYVLRNEYIKVIGNIYENKELLDV